MKKSSVNYPVKQFMKMWTNGTISFDYPIQRKGGQWDKLQKSLLIHSLAGDYPVPALYSIVEEKMVGEEGKEKKKNVYFILDGKQRLTNIKGFIDGDYPLHEDTPDVYIDDNKYVLAERTFDELEEDVQDQILSFSLQIYKMDEITDEEIEDMFFRLNNGTPLSKQQKAKSKMGTEWAKEIKSVMEHPLMTEKASFTDLQLRKADDETALMQTMMIMDKDFEMKNISSNEVFNYAMTFRGDDSKKKLISEIVEVFDYLNEAFEGKETIMLKKVHFPMTIITAQKAMEMGIHPIRFNDWKEEFKKALKGKSDIKTLYTRFSGQGSVKREKALGRVEEMERHLSEYFDRYSKDSNLIEEGQASESEITELENQDNTVENQTNENEATETENKDSETVNQ